MIFRIADMNDLYQLKMVYSDIVNHMYENNIKIWDEVYPTAYFNEDIKNQRLYVLEDHDTILSAFALSDRHSGENHIKWPGKGCKALYLDSWAYISIIPEWASAALLLKRPLNSQNRKEPPV